MGVVWWLGRWEWCGDWREIRVRGWRGPGGGGFGVYAKIFAVCAQSARCTPIFVVLDARSSIHNKFPHFTILSVYYVYILRLILTLSYISTSLEIMTILSIEITTFFTKSS